MKTARWLVVVAILLLSGSVLARSVATPADSEVRSLQFLLMDHLHRHTNRFPANLEALMEAVPHGRENFRWQAFGVPIPQAYHYWGTNGPWLVRGRESNRVVLMSQRGYRMRKWFKEPSRHLVSLKWNAAGEPELRAWTIPEKDALKDPALVAAGIKARKPLTMPPVTVLEIVGKSLLVLLAIGALWLALRWFWTVFVPGVRAAASLSTADSRFVFFRERFAGEIGLVLLAGAYLTVALGSWLRLSHREWLLLPAGILLGVAAKMPFRGLHHGSARTRIVALVALLVVWSVVAWMVAGLFGVG